jgi:hypothetical protein
MLADLMETTVKSEMESSPGKDYEVTARWRSGKGFLTDFPCRHNRSMAIKAICVDDSNTHHVIIGLTREDIDTILRGDVYTLPCGAAPLSKNSDIVIVFAETDEDLEKRFPPALKPV